jgi:hypothetical protein
MNNETDNGSTLSAQECITSLNKQSPLRKVANLPLWASPQCIPTTQKAYTKGFVLQKPCNYNKS